MAGSQSDTTHCVSTRPARFCSSFHATHVRASVQGCDGRDGRSSTSQRIREARAQATHTCAHKRTHRALCAHRAQRPIMPPSPPTPPPFHTSCNTFALAHCSHRCRVPRAANRISKNDTVISCKHLIIMMGVEHDDDALGAKKNGCVQVYNQHGFY